MGVGDREKPQECRRVTYLTPHSCSEIREVVNKKGEGRRGYKKRIVETANTRKGMGSSCLGLGILRC